MRRKIWRLGVGATVIPNGMATEALRALIGIAATFVLLLGMLRVFASPSVLLLRSSARFCRPDCSRRLAGKSGSIEVRLTDGVHLPFADCSFDKAFSVHTLYFWKEPEATLSEIARVLAPRGILVLVFRDKDDPAAALFPETIYRFYSAGDVRELFGTAGLECTEQTRVSSPGRGIVLLKALKVDRDVQ